MPRRSLLSAADRVALFSPPDNLDDLIRYYTLTEQDVALIRRRRGHDQRYGFAVMLCYMRYPGVVLSPNESPLPSQARGAKDAVRLRTAEGRWLRPTEEMLKRLNEIPDSMTFEAVSSEIAVEQIGQSISYNMHHRLMESVRAHLLRNSRRSGQMELFSALRA